MAQVRKVNIFHGDNGHQEYWESARDTVCLLRVKSENFWQIWLKGKVQYKDSQHTITDGAKTESEAAEILLKDYNILVQFKHHKHWVEQDAKLEYVNP